MEKLSTEEIINLIKSVFPLFPGDKRLGILVDVPRDPAQDQANWKQRRRIAEDWFGVFRESTADIGLEAVTLIAYADVGSNNADLPESGFYIRQQLPEAAGQLKEFGSETPFDTIFSDHQLFLAPTQYSATAPLKVAAKKFGFRAATMPGFSPAMIPALRIDYNEVARRVQLLKERLDPALWADVDFVVDGKKEYHIHFDLRFRQGHLSPGRFPQAGTAGNLPSGETYIVPYEGELAEKSQTEGTLPVQVNGDIALFTVRENRALSVSGIDGDRVTPVIQAEIDHLGQEPAYGNMAELGFGVLGDFGLQPINEILLDEKLGFHIAFGRSDHFDGAVGPGDFSSPQAVIHLDRIYIPATQPRITVRSVVLGYENDKSEEIIQKGNYLIF